MSKVLFEPGDRVPQLELVRAERVQVGEVVWGWQWQDNLRKGFALETEGMVVERVGPTGDGSAFAINSVALSRDRLVLVQVHP